MHYLHFFFAKKRKICLIQEKAVPLHPTVKPNEYINTGDISFLQRKTYFGYMI